MTEHIIVSVGTGYTESNEKLIVTPAYSYRVESRALDNSDSFNPFCIYALAELAMTK